MAGTGMYWTLSVPWDSDVFMFFAHEFLADSWDGELQHKRLIVHLAKSAVSYRPTASNDKTQLPHKPSHGIQIVSCIVS